MVVAKSPAVISTVKTFEPIPRERFLATPETTAIPFILIVAVASLTVGVIRA